MTYVMLLVLVAAAVGVGIWAYSAAFTDDDLDDDGNGAAQRNVTSTDVTPPAHPQEPVPGSDAARHQQGAP